MKAWKQGEGPPWPFEYDVIELDYTEYLDEDPIDSALYARISTHLDIMLALVGNRELITEFLERIKIKG